jgi:hypothetical protein
MAVQLLLASMSMAINGLSRRIHPGFRVTPGGHLPSPFRKGKAMKLRSVMATVGASGAVTFQLIANIPPARAADSVRVRSTIVSPDGSMLTVKTREGATTAVETRGRREGRAG